MRRRAIGIQLKIEFRALQRIRLPQLIQYRLWAYVTRASKQLEPPHRRLQCLGIAGKALRGQHGAKQPAARRTTTVHRHGIGTKVVAAASRFAGGNTKRLL